LDEWVVIQEDEIEEEIEDNMANDQEED